ncbi:MAG TPA: hypothetical protein ENK72_01080, partial [Epsilonproteobacteria bacterium]|nr:hypothetical protein [Campylobacterota bacterium]
MAFVNEYVSQEDIEKYGLDELHRRCSRKADNYKTARDGLHDRSQWMIDREKEIWFMRLGIRMVPGENPPIYLGNDIYILHYKGENIEVVMKDNRKEGSTKLSDDPFRIRWDILSIASSSLNGVQTEEIIELIQQAMEVYGLEGV